MRLGVHVSIAGGFEQALERARGLSCTAAQIFTRSPRGGAAPPIDLAEAARLEAGWASAGIEPLVVHAPYILNLASAVELTWKRSLALYEEEYRRVHQLKARYLVTHVGSLGQQPEADGIRRVASAIDATLSVTDSSSLILLENTAGSGQGLGSRFEQLRAIREAVKDRKRVGICLDTAHLFAAGYAIHTAEGLVQTIAEFDREVGLEHVRVIHLNDSKVPFDSKVDRHWHIGEGHIGREAFGRIVNHPALRDLPFILETPKDSEADDVRNLEAVRELRKDASAAGSTRHARRKG